MAKIDTFELVQRGCISHHYKPKSILDPASQSEMAAFFGLGANSTVDEVRIDWPSGKVETYQDVSAGMISFVEGNSGQEDSGM